MKVLHFHPDGRMASRFIDPLVTAERVHGIESTLITSIGRSGTSDGQVSYDLSLRNLLGLPLTLLRICWIIGERRPDIVISHNTKSSLLPLLSAWLMGVKDRVYFNHGVPYVGYTGVLRWLLCSLEHLNCIFATRVLTVSPDMAAPLSAVRKQARPTIILRGSACGIDLRDYNPELFKKSAWRQNNHISTNDTVIVFVGRPERRKGFEHVLRLWSEYLTESKYKLVLCGPGPIDVLRVIPSIPPNVISLGFVDNVPEILSQADGLIMTSYHEGLSYAVLEAMASRCVVFANDIEGVRCLVLDGVNGYLVQNNDPTTYASLIKSMAFDKESTRDVRDKAVITAGWYSRDLFLPAYLSFLEGLIKGRRRRSIDNAA